MAAPWLLDLSVESHGRAAVHLPLIYASRLRVEHEAYAAALARFPSIVGLGHTIGPEVVDGAVAVFAVEEREALRDACFDALASGPALASAVARRWVPKGDLPAACLAAERELVADRAVGAAALSRLFGAVAEAIALSLLNPFVESAFLAAHRLFAGSDLFDELVRKTEASLRFSFLKYFQTRLQELEAAAAEGPLAPERLVQFCWEVGFLAGAGSEETDYDDPHATAARLGARFVPGLRGAPGPQLRAPRFETGCSTVVERLAGSDNLLERCVALMAMLQLHEDLRHYWQCRAVRLFRLLATGPAGYDHHRSFEQFVSS